MGRPPDSLRAAYATSAYGPVGGRFVLQAAPSTPPHWAKAGRTWAIVTAWNPKSVWQPEALNQAAAAALAHQIRAEGWQSEPAWNGEGQWREESLLVWDVPLKVAVRWGQVFGQNAVLWGIGSRAALVWEADGPQPDPIERFWLAGI